MEKEAIQESNIAELTAKIESNAPLTAPEKKTIVMLIQVAAKVLRGVSNSPRRARKFASDKERYDYHNAQRKLKKQQEKGESK